MLENVKKMWCKIYVKIDSAIRNTSATRHHVSHHPVTLHPITFLKLHVFHSTNNSQIFSRSRFFFFSSEQDLSLTSANVSKNPQFSFGEVMKSSAAVKALFRLITTRETSVYSPIY